MPIRKLFAGALALLLAACIFSPGKFVSTLDVRRDGSFRYAYTGEIHLLALSKLAQMGREAEGKAEFVLQPCYADGTTEERNCSEDEVNTQKRDWAESQARAEERRRRDADQMKAVMGGIDPSDPKAAEELAARLRKQAGWKRVDYKGDGLFDVDFAIGGQLDRDFAFPTVERFPQANAFVTISPRQDGTVRIDAPGFGPLGSMEPWRSMMRGAAMAEAGKQDGERPSPFPSPDGRFTITTDAGVLANNTDDGPQAAPNGQKLEWTVNARSEAAPMALLRLAAAR